VAENFTCAMATWLASIKKSKIVFCKNVGISKEHKFN
jgi:hypothetical protein